MIAIPDSIRRRILLTGLAVFSAQLAVGMALVFGTLRHDRSGIGDAGGVAWLLAVVGLFLIALPLRSSSRSACAASLILGILGFLCFALVPAS